MLFESGFCRSEARFKSKKCGGLGKAHDVRQYQDVEFFVSNPPCDAEPFEQYYEWRTEPRLGWWCKMCWKYMDRMHSNTDSHKKIIWWAKETEAAKRMGYGSSGATCSSGFADQLQVPPPPPPFPSDPPVPVWFRHCQQQRAEAKAVAEK